MRGVRKLLVAALLIAAPWMAHGADEFVLRMASFEPGGLDPAIGGRGPETTINLFEPLIDAYAADGRLRPLAAESWSFSDDGLTLTLVLRRGLRWSDGAPLTMHHYRDGVLRVLEPGRATFRPETLFSIRHAAAYHAGTVSADAVGLHVVDDHTLVVGLEAPTPLVLRALGRPESFPVRVDLIDGDGNVVSTVGNGPYAIAQWEPGERIVLVPNPYYAGVWSAARGVDRVDASLHADPWRQGVRGFANGLFDVALVPPGDVADVLADPLLAAYARAVPITGAVMLAFDTVHGAASDPRVRRALAHAIDHETLAIGVLGSTVVPARSFSPAGIASASGEGRHAFDPVAARSLMDAAGYPDGRGFPAFEVVHVDQPRETALARAVAAMWRDALGIDVELVGLDPVALRAYRAERAHTPFDAYVFLTWSTLGDAAQVHNALLDDGASSAHTRYEDPEYLDIIRRAQHETDVDERDRLYRRAEAMVNRDVPIISLVQDASVWLIGPVVEGFESAVTGVGGLLRLANPPGVRLTR